MAPWAARVRLPAGLLACLLACLRSCQPPGGRLAAGAGWLPLCGALPLARCAPTAVNARPPACLPPPSWPPGADDRDMVEWLRDTVADAVRTADQHDSLKRVIRDMRMALETRHQLASIQVGGWRGGCSAVRSGRSTVRAGGLSLWTTVETSLDHASHRPCRPPIPPGRTPCRLLTPGACPPHPPLPYPTLLFPLSGGRRVCNLHRRAAPPD